MGGEIGSEIQKKKTGFTVECSCKFYIDANVDNVTVRTLNTEEGFQVGTVLLLQNLQQVSKCKKSQGHASVLLAGIIKVMVFSYRTV